MRLEGKVAIVTGAVGGIGRAIVETLVAEGARVLAADLDGAQVAEMSTDAIQGHGVDVTDFAEVEAMVDAAVERFGTLDIVINNAGIGEPRPLLDHDPMGDFDRVTAVNQKGVYHGILASDEANCINGTTVNADDGFLGFKYPLVA